jgi:hypothetical protein
MIRYTVLWRTDVEADLATIWADATDRRAITSAANRVDAELRSDAESKGSEISEGLKLLPIAPLTAYFRVDPADRKVYVEAIELISR